MKKGKQTILIGVFTLAVGLIIALESFYYVSTGAVGGIIIVYGAMNYRSAKRRLSAQQCQPIRTSSS